MSETTAIEWCDSTFNPWIGCTKISPGCDHCYAEVSTPARTLGIEWGPHGERRRTAASNWALPVRWEKQHAEFHQVHGRRRRVFCASLADVFDTRVPPEWFNDLMMLIQATPNLDWLLLTKRPQNILRRVWDFGCPASNGLRTLPGNVWLGTTVEDQIRANRNVLELLHAKVALQAPVAFLSMEPLLEQVRIDELDGPKGAIVRPLLGQMVATRLTGGVATVQFPKVDWVIVGGESGPCARPMHPDWVRSLRDQCAAAGTAFFFKQWGEFDLSYDRVRDDPDCRHCDAMCRLPGRWINLAGGHGFNGERVHYAHKVGKRAAGRLLDGVVHDAWPKTEVNL